MELLKDDKKPVGLRKNFEFDENYVIEGKTTFEDVKRVVSLMASFEVYETGESVNIDYYFETPDNFFSGFNTSIRLRDNGTNHIVSITYTVNETNDIEIKPVTHEYSKTFDKDCFITNNDDCLLFLEDKIREVYSHYVDLDIFRILKTLKPVLVVQTERNTDYVKNNDKFTCSVNYDFVQYKTKRQHDKQNVIEIKLISITTQENIDAYKRFLKELNSKVVLIPMGETKYDVGMRVRKYVKMSKKKAYELEKEREEAEKEDK